MSTKEMRDLFSKEKAEVRNLNVGYVNERWAQLYTLEKETSTEGIKYLFMVNAGAAVAVLAFIGSVQQARDLSWPRWMLIFFVLGLIVIGVFHILRNARMATLFTNWRNLSSAYYADQKTFQEIVTEDNAKAGKYGWIGNTLAYVSFACFIAGTSIGVCNFSSLNSGDNHVRQETDPAIEVTKSASSSKKSDAGEGLRQREIKGNAMRPPSGPNTAEEKVTPSKSK